MRGGKGREEERGRGAHDAEGGILEEEVWHLRLTEPNMTQY